MNNNLLIKQIEDYKAKMERLVEISNYYKSIDASVFIESVSYFDELIEGVKEHPSLKKNYIKQLQSDSEEINKPCSLKLDFELNSTHREYYEVNTARVIQRIKKSLKVAKFNLNIFKKLNFFDENIVCVGANGSGKSTLATKMREYLPNLALTISAQKLLIIPVFESIDNPNNTLDALKATQSLNKSTKFKTKARDGYSSGEENDIKNEFKVLLNNLISENFKIIYKSTNEHVDGEQFEKPVTRLNKTIRIWNSLIQHRVLKCEDGINITLHAHATMGRVSYPAYMMSDGEKVILYYIAHVLQAPNTGFIIVDEPEMYLHKTLTNKLWDILERERQDCQFVYLTHDLDFATSRNNAKKVWIKSYTYPDEWEVENIPDNDIPEPLLLELLGSRKRILFCESKNERVGLDEQLYNLLLPGFTITPVESCSNVINYTKAFNNIRSVSIEAFGLIDSDHQNENRINSLKRDNIYVLNVSEVENLLLDEDFLVEFSKSIMFIDEGRVISIVEEIKNDIIKDLLKQKELQVANYISSKINYYFEDSHVSKGNTLNQVERNYESFIDKVDIKNWYKTRSLEIQNIIDMKDYRQALYVFNNKGLKAKVNTKFEIRDFEKRAINYLKSKPESHSLLLRHLPNELVI